MARDRVVVVGAGVGGLSAAIDLARAGVEVLVLERSGHVGGKLAQTFVGDLAFDAGPTVLTMRETFEGLFEDAGARLSDFVTLEQAEVLCRHAWAQDGATLDLFGEVERSVDAIGRFAGAREAHGYRRFVEHGRRLFEAVEAPILRAARPSVLRAIGAQRDLLDTLRLVAPHRGLWDLLGDFFQDGRLRQLFGRYATYAGASPFHAPASLAVIAHVEREGVWIVRGGMARLGQAIGELARSLGVEIRTDAHVERISTDGRGASGVVLAGGERVGARAVVWNGDVAALAAGLAGPDARRAASAPPERSLSAVTLCFAAASSGVPLVRHTVAFSRDYREEFVDLVDRRRWPRSPTVYVCAQDRDARGELPPEARARGERIFALVNAPATGDQGPWHEEEIEACEKAARAVLRSSGIELEDRSAVAVTTPPDFARRFPATGGALYGGATHGVTSALSRPTSRTRMPGLYLAGGSVHPGAGLPLVLTSGRLAAASVREGLASTRSWLRAAIAGGTSTR